MPSSAQGRGSHFQPLLVSKGSLKLGTLLTKAPGYPSWNQNASVIFLDQVSSASRFGTRVGQANLAFDSQPVGVGYSYADKSDKGVWTTDAAAEDVSTDVVRSDLGLG